MELLENHRSVRSFLQKEVQNDILTELLEAGIRASNTGNMQLYSVIVTRDSSKKKLLSPFHFNQPMVAKAPVLLTICFDVSRFYKWCYIRNTEADFSKSRIDEIYREKENLEVSEKFVVENGKENLAQVYTEVRYKKEDSDFFSKKLTKMLTDQGFRLE